MIDSIGPVGANTPSAGLATIEAAAKGVHRLSQTPSGGKDILGGSSLEVTDGELNRWTGVLEKTKPRNVRLAERRNPTPGTQPAATPPSADPLAPSTL